MVQKKKIHNFDSMDYYPIMFAEKSTKLKFGYMSPSGKTISIMKQIEPFFLS